MKEKQAAVGKTKPEPLGIAQRIRVNSISDLKSVLEEYAKQFAKHLPFGVKSVEESSEKYFMATDGQGRFWVTGHQSGQFNPKGNLLRAMQRIHEGTPLDRDDKYAVEALWHPSQSQ